MAGRQTGRHREHSSTGFYIFLLWRDIQPFLFSSADFNPVSPYNCPPPPLLFLSLHALMCWIIMTGTTMGVKKQLWVLMDSTCVSLWPALQLTQGLKQQYQLTYRSLIYLFITETLIRQGVILVKKKKILDVTTLKELFVNDAIVTWPILASTAVHSVERKRSMSNFFLLRTNSSSSGKKCQC